ncbi:hypothetical protein ACFVJ8_23810 [Streptomyces yangpuensis]|uniref:hypothetical protein n=1 Tax=Streptomyces yangpuensis TaxID=1648182 RepID=UPI0036350F3F
MDETIDDGQTPDGSPGDEPTYSQLRSALPVLARIGSRYDLEHGGDAEAVREIEKPLLLARSWRARSDSPADQARWDAWIAALTPSPQGIRGTWAQVCLLAVLGRAMLQALRETLVPCLSVGSVAQEIQRRIDRGALAPSARIRKRKLTKELRVPASYIGLALVDLAATGLVEVHVDGHSAVAAIGDRVSRLGQRQRIGATEARAA